MTLEIKLRNYIIGEGHPTYIIAEMSANHAGSLENALKIVRLAKKSGANCIKIQTYTADTLTINSEKPYFQITEGTWKGENLYDLYKKAYTPWEWHDDLMQEAKRVGIDFLSTPFDNTAVDFLDDLGVEFYKIASFECTHLPLIKYIASKKKPIIISTGMASLGEIQETVEVIRNEGIEKLCLLKCSSAYPAVLEDMNLRNLPDLKSKFNCLVGFSDHSENSMASIIAVAMGASVIEKHFCISRNIVTPDSSFSLEPEEFSKMVRDIRRTEKVLGKISYELSVLEQKSKIFRRSIFAIEDIRKGEAFTENNLRIIRPGQGLAPKHFETILGKKAKTDIERGTPINWDLIR